MSAGKQAGSVEGSIGLLMLLWGLAPTIAAIGIVACYSGVGLGPYLGETLVGWLIFSIVSQIIWGSSVASIQEIPDHDRGGRVILLTFLGLLLNGILVFGGCVCLVSSALN